MKKYLKDARIVIDGKEVDTSKLNPKQVQALLMEALGVKDDGSKEEKDRSKSSL